MQRSLIHESSRHKHGSGSKPLYTHNPSHFLWKPVRYIHHLNEQVRMLPFMKDRMFPLNTALHPCLRASRSSKRLRKVTGVAPISENIEVSHSPRCYRYTPLCSHTLLSYSQRVASSRTVTRTNSDPHILIMTVPYGTKHSVRPDETLLIIMIWRGSECVCILLSVSEHRLQQ